MGVERPVAAIPYAGAARAGGGGRAVVVVGVGVVVVGAYHRTHTCLGLKLLFLGNNGVGGTPPPAFWGIIKTKGYFWSFWVQILFSCFFVPILYYTGTLVCSTVLLHHPSADKNAPK